MILSIEQQIKLKEFSLDFNQEQLIFLAGYFMGLAEKSNHFDKIDKEFNTPITKKELSIIVGSKSGNGKKIAQRIKETFESSPFSIQIKDMNDYVPTDIQKEKNAIIIISTHGEGEPPIQAEEFYQFIHGTRIKKLVHLNFCVIALGDKTYNRFCQTGKDLDKKLEELGAKRIQTRIDCDVDFDDTVTEWIDAFSKVFHDTPQSTQIKTSGIVSNQKKEIYNKNHPYISTILDKINLNAKDSTKKTYHIELLNENSKISFQPGDALGVIPTNDPFAVNTLLEYTGWIAEEEFEYKNKVYTATQLFREKVEINHIDKEFLGRFNQIIGDKKLKAILKNEDATNEYIKTHRLIDVLNLQKNKYDQHKIATILPELKPRLYSIASSQKAFAEEIHLTVGLLQYQINNYWMRGVCSGYLGEDTQLNDNIQVYAHENTEFRLPESHKDIIMIGAGTGIAPFRAFIQEREAVNASGKNWLFFGDRNFTSDFLYQTEWQKYKNKGLLTKINTAFSRDQKEKIYIQHKLEKQGEDLFKWIENGAVLYVCGDKNQMAKDVLISLKKIIQKQTGYNAEDTDQYFKKLVKNKQYLEDVY